MRLSGRGVGKRTTFLALLMVGVAGSTAAFAQGAPQVLDYVVKLLTALRADVAAVQDSVDALNVPPSNVRATGAVTFTVGEAVCVVTNVDDTSHRVKVSVVKSDGNPVTDPLELALQPNVTSGFGIGPAFAGTYSCRFEVVDGTRDDIRGAINLANTLFGTTTVSQPAD